MAFAHANMDLGEALIRVAWAVQLSAKDPGDAAQVWIEALASDDEKTAGCAQSMLGVLEQGPGQWKPFEIYQALLAKHPEDPPAQIVEYMYGRDKDEGVKTLIRPTRDISTPAKKAISNRRERELLLSQHMVSNAEWFSSNVLPEDREAMEDRAIAIAAAARQLAKLAEAEEWWVRLYAVSVATRDTEFRGAAWVKRLREDKEEHVRTAARMIEE